MDTEASATAIGACSMRAAHLIYDADPKVFRDEFALRFCGYDSEEALRKELDAGSAAAIASLGKETANNLMHTVRASIVARSRYTEDAFAEAMKHGVKNMVILGAGLDSFAWRRTDLAKDVKVYEIDHPASQAWKRKRLEELGMTTPSNLTFIPIDFEKQTLLEGLRKGGLPMNEPAFFSWLGVTMYLKRETVLETLRQVASFPSGSEIIFTFRVAQELVAETDRKLDAMIAAGAAARNEPYMSAYDPEELMGRMREMGFGEINHYSHEHANATYFAGRSDGLHMYSISDIMLARVK